MELNEKLTKIYNEIVDTFETNEYYGEDKIKRLCYEEGYLDGLINNGVINKVEAYIILRELCKIEEI